MTDQVPERRVSQDEIIRAENKTLVSLAKQIFERVEKRIPAEGEGNQIPVGSTGQVTATSNTNESGQFIGLAAPVALITHDPHQRGEFWFQREIGPSVDKYNLGLDDQIILYILKIPIHLDPLTAEHFKEHPELFEDEDTEFFITADKVIKTVYLPQSLEDSREAIDENIPGGGDEDVKQVPVDIDLRELEYLVLITRRYSELIPE